MALRCKDGENVVCTTLQLSQLYVCGIGTTLVLYVDRAELTIVELNPTNLTSVSWIQMTLLLLLFV